MNLYKITRYVKEVYDVEANSRDEAMECELFDPETYDIKTTCILKKRNYKPED